MSDVYSGTLTADFGNSKESIESNDEVQNHESYVKHLISENIFFSFDEQAKLMTSLTSDRGVLKRVLKSASSNEELIKNNDKIKFHYTGYLDGSDEPFDSTYLTNSPLTTKLSDKRIIVGLQIAIKTMKVGEISRFILQPQYAFYNDNLLPKIPRAAEVLYDIEIISSISGKDSDQYFELYEDDRRKLPFDQIKEIIEENFNSAKQYFVEKLYCKSLKIYKECKFIFGEHFPTSDEEKIEFKNLTIKLMNNLAATYLRLSNYQNAITYSSKVLNLDPNNLKALVRRAEACIRISEFSRAKADLDSAMRISPSNSNLKQFKDMYEKEKSYYELCQKTFAKKILGGKAIHSSDIIVKQDIKDMITSVIQELLDDVECDSIPFKVFGLSDTDIRYIELRAKEALLEIDYIKENECHNIVFFRK